MPEQAWIKSSYSGSQANCLEVTVRDRIMQYLAELVQHGLGISVLPPMSVRSVTAHVSTIRITPPLRRDIGAVVAATRPPTGAAQALLDLLAADINSRR